MTSSRENTTLSELLIGRDTLVLSPHMDDAVLSASSVVLDHPSAVWTVFTAAPAPAQTTSWDLSCGFANSDETIAARRLEDAAAFAGTPARTRHLDQLEGAYATREQHRQACSRIEAELDGWMATHPDGVVFAPACAGLHMPPAPWEPVLRAAARFRQALPTAGTHPTREALSDDGPTNAGDATGASDVEPAPESDATTHPGGTASGPARMVYALLGPAKALAQKVMHAEHVRRRRRTMGDDGLAANPDHLALRDITLKLAAHHPGVLVVLYEDLPYLWHARGQAEVDRLRARTGLEARTVTAPVDTERKHRHLAHYASQLPVLDRRGRLMAASTLPAEEVFWIVT